MSLPPQTVPCLKRFFVAGECRLPGVASIITVISRTVFVSTRGDNKNKNKKKALALLEK